MGEVADERVRDGRSRKRDADAVTLREGPVATKDITQRPLFIFEMANNHMGSFAHGLKIIAAMREVSQGFPFQFAVKLQYRDLDSYIHPDYKNRSDLKFVKRFSETRLSWDEFRSLKEAISGAGFTAICTPFNETAVDRVEEHGYDFIKIASCALTDWPLLERIIKSDRPVIASLAGEALEDIDRVVAFFRHRDRPLAIMHCVGEYPTRDENLQLGQILVLKGRYPEVEIGYSTHEQPDNVQAVQMAIAMGATIFEKHVGLPTDTTALNAYSANPGQVRRWLESAAAAYRMCGPRDTRYSFSSMEVRTLGDLRRGVFVKHPVGAGEQIRPEDVFFAIPATEGQVVANDMSKYSTFQTLQAIPANGPIMSSSVKVCDQRAEIYRIVQGVKKVLKRSKVPVPGACELEISHHYGIERYHEFGLTMITVVNREYCKKLIVMLPHQHHPEQWHDQKEETFHILYGEISVVLDGVEEVKKVNDVIRIGRGVRHSFTARTATVIEEVSSTHCTADSFYSDPVITTNKNRKTFVAYWMD
jgi:sialic acid synthase SpsE/mannose-6-phosphate isomerase-like protein (cupin superfamily)